MAADPGSRGAGLGSRAATVASGILLSRIAGFVRDRAVAYWFGVGAYADVFRTALRGPNILQNLLGEGTISAAFIPIYSRLIEDGREEDAGRFAGAILGLLISAAAVVALLGVLLAPEIVTLLAPGFLADAEHVAAGTATVNRFPLAVVAVRIIFPMTGILVLSAWALGVLNSHRRFFLPYVAPVLWNVAIIVGLAVAGAGASASQTVAAEDLRDRLLIGACLGALVGGALQFGVQLPLVFRLLRGFRLSISTRIEGVRDAVRAVGPVIAGRGVYQLSAYLDLLLASLLAAGAVGALGWAQTLYVLPVSLFGMSVAAAELPELSRQSGREAESTFVERLRRSLRQMAFLIVPTTVGYLAFGFLLVGALYRTGRFTVADNWLVYLVLAGYTLGLPATTWSRLLQNAYYALRDTRTPARIAVARVTVSAAAALPMMFALDRVPLGRIAGGGGRGLFLGAAGLSAASALGAWTELLLLRRGLVRKVNAFALPGGAALRMATVAVTAAVPVGALAWLVPGGHVALRGALVVAAYGAVYLALARAAGLSEAAAWIGRLTRRG